MVLMVGCSINPPANIQFSGSKSSLGIDNTFSIIGFDPQNGALGVAVATARLAVGNRVPFAVFGVGAIATQANTNVARLCRIKGIKSGESCAGGFDDDTAQ